MKRAACKSLLVVSVLCLLVFGCLPMRSGDTSAALSGEADGAAVAGRSGRNDLVIAKDGLSHTRIIVSPDAGQFEAMAANDLARYIEMMTGATVPVLNTREAIDPALREDAPLLVVGSEALAADRSIGNSLRKVAKQKPILRADAIVLHRRGNIVYLAGLTDDGHYHAVSALLHLWGCRWYLPTEFGECIPRHTELRVGELNFAYASPLEMRTYWISWNGSTLGQREFQLRNFMTIGVGAPGGGHALGQYTQELVPEGKSIFEVPIAEETTIAHVAEKLDAVFKTSGSASVAVEDGVYRSDSPTDIELKAGLFDKYFMTPTMTDVFMTLYNGVCERLLAKYPDSTAKLGFLAYVNMTIPPQRVLRAARPLFCSLAPIDIDPNHGMDDHRSPPRQEYREIMYRWSEVMDGRVWIYDYDQGMLVWRDLPNPSHQAFRQDVKHYAKAGILGVGTECRNAIATVFLNLYFRGQLMWNPEFDVDGALAEFYQKFYGPVAEPMSRYWNALFKAWEDTIVTEHEFFTAPAIYTPELLATMRENLELAEKMFERIPKPTGKWPRELTQVQERLRFTRLSFDLTDQYMGMVRAAATECEYKKAETIGRQALQTRMELARMNPTFTTRVVGVAAEPQYGGSPAWFPGEVKLYADLAQLVDGTEGRLVAKLPLEWAFRRDPNDTGLPSGWAYKPVDLTYWNENKGRYTIETREDYPTTEWEMVSTDLYVQAQGVLHPDWQSFTGFAWYHTPVRLTAAQARQKVHVRFPGLFGEEAWLYVNGRLVAYRKQSPMWWHTDYAFNWDVDLSEHLQAGENTLVVRIHNRHHMCGMFRRPFLYAPVAQ